MKVRRRYVRPSAWVLRDAQVEASAFFAYMQRFLEHSAAIGKSGETVDVYRHELYRFICWCDERSLAQPQEVTRPILERYRRYLFHLRKRNGEPLGFTTQRSRLQALKMFFRWMTRENFLLSNPASELELPRRPHRLPRQVLSVEMVEHVLAHTLRRGVLGIRDRAMLETLYSSGLRRAELVALHLADVDTRRGIVRVRGGKGDKDRYVPLGARAAQWIVRYSEDVRPDLAIEPDRGVLFLHESGEAFKKHQLGDLVKRILVGAGVEGVGSCHLFRHAMATHMLEGGCDVRYLQAILGHADLSTTAIYTQVAIGKLQAIHAATHPASAARPADPPDPTDAALRDTLLATLAAESLVEAAES